MLAMHTANGAQNMMLRLTPAELGTVQIQITRSHDGAAVSVLVERPETLRLLLHDQAQLQHALTQAGLPQDRTLSFQQAPAGSFAAQDHRASTQEPGHDAGQNPGQGGNDHGQAGRDGAARQGQSGQDARSGSGRSGPGAQLYASAWQPAGIDITA
jgi:chemotaxis protein MotD